MAASPKPRVFLMDAMSFIFRAYHAMARQRPMSTRGGVPTAATYVFVNMLRKLRADFAPEYLAAVFDLAAPTFRDAQGAAVATISKFDIKTQTFKEEKYGGYKANRAQMPPDLAEQLPYIRRALAAYRIPILEYAGFEADDVIGTLARKAAEQSHLVFVVSNDKDMLQLVDEKVFVLNPPKDNLVCDPAKVEEILGVRPEQVVDVMALRGDPIDNIPGAPGIGDKGSVEIIRRFGTLEGALARAAEVEKKTYRESLQQHAEQIRYSRQQVTIDRHVPVEFDLDAMQTHEPDLAACRALFSELEFTTLLAEVATPEAALGAAQYGELRSAAELASLARQVEAEGLLALAFAQPPAARPTGRAEEEEVESDAGEAKLPLAPPAESGGAERSSIKDSGTADFQTLTAALSAKPGEALALELGRDRATDAAFAQLLANVSVPKAIHDYKAAIHALESPGISLAGVRHDPQLYSYLLNPTHASQGLEAIALRNLNLKLSGSPAQAADITGRLARSLRQQVEAAGLEKVYEEIDLPLIPVLARMESAGVMIEPAALAQMSQRLERERDEKARQIHHLAGQEFNINSPRQLGDVLFNQMALPKPVKYGKGKTISTAVEVLEELAEEHDIARHVLEYRQLAKLKSTYVDALPALLNPRTHRLHTTFNAVGTATGRLSSVNPNLQNIPIRTELGREIRAAFTAERGWLLLSADYSQIELRLLAHFSEDPFLIEAFQRGDDIHTLTAAQVFGVAPLLVTPEQRRGAKAINFGIVYGLSAFGLAQQLGIEQKEARQFIEAYFAKYVGVRKFIDRTLAESRRAQAVKTLFGRVRPIPDMNSKNPNARGFAERTAVNTPLQGTAADLIKLAMIAIDAEIGRRKLQARMTLQVHDELVFEVPEAELEAVRALVRERMQGVCMLRVPLLVEMGVGANWRDLQ